MLSHNPSLSVCMLPAYVSVCVHVFNYNFKQVLWQGKRQTLSVSPDNHERQTAFGRPRSLAFDLGADSGFLRVHVNKDSDKPDEFVWSPKDETAAASGWEFCAGKNGRCHCPGGKVRFGGWGGKNILKANAGGGYGGTSLHAQIICIDEYYFNMGNVMY